MAGRGERDADSTISRVICSVCLEPYRGRQPKLLPCYHTFCLPCLSELAQASPGNTGDEAMSATVTCPACRKVVSVPPGGVAGFQSNFYIDEEVIDTQPSTCQLCDGDEEVNYLCSKCGQFCSCCQRVHAKLCSALVTSRIHISSKAGLAGAVRPKSQGQVEVIEMVIELLQDNLKQVRGQQQAIEQQLHARYAEGLRFLTAVRDECLVSLKEISENAESKLWKEMDVAQKARAQISPQSRQTGGPQGEQWLSETVMKRFEGYRDKGSVWSLSYDSGTSSPQSCEDACFKEFMGRVVVSGTQFDSVLHGLLVPEGSADSWLSSMQNTETGTTQTAHDLTPHAHSSGCVPYSQFSDLMGKFEALSKMMSSLQAELKAVKLQCHQLSRDEEVLRKDMSTCRDIVQTLKDKNTLLCQDVALLQTHNFTKIQQDLSELRQDMHDFSDMREVVTADIRELRDTMSSTQSQLSSLQTCTNDHDMQLAKFKQPVAFHVLLHTDVGVNTQRVLILKDEIVNIGNGYDTSTGYFTAPVPGVYLFMATSCSGNEGESAMLDIVHEDKDIAFLSANNNSCSCHVAIKVLKGDKVWLRTFKPEDNEKMHYQAGWKTNFCGVLVQPDF